MGNQQENDLLKISLIEIMKEQSDTESDAWNYVLTNIEF